MAALLSSCDQFLDKKPTDSIIDTPEYWSVYDNVQMQTNRLYNNYLGYGGSTGDFYFKSLNDDQADPNFTTGEGNWPYNSAPGNEPQWKNPYVQIRGCNYIISGVRQGSLSTADKHYFEGIARLNRAYQYFTLVKKYGDCVWESEVVKTTDSDILYGPRTSRDVVMDSVIADLQYAAATIGNNKSTGSTAWSGNLANAMLADAALFEGTFCKYRTLEENGLAPNAERAQKYLTIAANAAQEVMNAGYKLKDEYGTVYNSLDLSSNSEAIFFKAYSQPSASFGHGTIAYTNSSTPMKGLSRDAFNAFLFLDGKPLATTSMDRNDAAEIVDGRPVIENLLKVRDQRLRVLIDNGLGFNEKMYYNRYEGSPNMQSSTGYTVRKFYTPLLTNYQLETIGQNITQCPLYSLAPVLLAYAEAKAELGTITQDDLDKTVNALNGRAGLPAMSLNPEADPANNMDVSPLIWEIRRCRRCELMFDGNRYWDLIRWHQLELLATTADNRAVLQGANLINVPADQLSNVQVVESPLYEGSTVMGKYINVTPTMNRAWNPRYYLYPIPTTQLTLNPQLKQNLGW